MDLIITPDAQKQLRSMPKADMARLVAALQAIVDAHPQRQGYVTEIVGKPGFWRARKGDYRAVFTITGAAVVVVAAGHRKDIYQ